MEGGNSIRVFARIRPGAGAAVTCVDGATVALPESVYAFDGAGGPETSQEAVFQAVGLQLCDAVLAGVNACLLA